MSVSLSTAETFKDRWVTGLVAAYGRTVRRVPDAYGVASVTAPRRGKVAVIVGGGCGHYPAFAGLVGPGLADAAVVGDVFTSPSAEQAYRTAKAVEGGAGVVFSYGNYAGDVMHFGLAGRRLAAEGIDARQMIVTDDVASAPAERAGDRRGVAGDFFVFKALGAAAERGDDLATVMAMGERANEVTRTFGAAFGGCTLPGQAEPLFTVDPSEVELGLGIHGEPGMRTAPAMDALELADTLVDQLLDQLPDVGSDRVAVLLNGLGSTPYEDLFAIYGRVHERLRRAGLRPHRPEVGEFVTSMDMAGVSLTLMPLDDTLAELYDAPCETPAFRLPAHSTLISSPAPAAEDVAFLRSGGSTGSSPASDDSGATSSDAGGIAAAALDAALAVVVEHEDELGRLDAVAADGDHGQGIVRGMRGAVAAARTTGVTGSSGGDVGTALLAAGTALADAAGGASGALFGLLLTEVGGQLQPMAGGEITTGALADAVAAAQGAVEELGGAHPGDKTMVDALTAFRASLVDAGADDDLVATWQAAADDARRAAEATADLTPTVGRAARLGDRGRGSPDPGATSLALMLVAAGEELARHGGSA